VTGLSDGKTVAVSARILTYSVAGDERACAQARRSPRMASLRGLFFADNASVEWMAISLIDLFLGRVRELCLYVVASHVCLLLVPSVCSRGALPHGTW